jgi:hypothetical protein
MHSWVLVQNWNDKYQCYPVDGTAFLTMINDGVIHLLFGLGIDEGIK